MPVLYVMSYAPLVRFREGADSPDSSLLLSGVGSSLYYVYNKTEYPLYRPVDWLIEETPLDTPLLIWADLWGVRRQTIGGAFDST